MKKEPELLKVSFSENTCGIKLSELWRKGYIFPMKYISMSGCCENLPHGVQKLQFPLVLNGTKCLSSHVFHMFTVHVYLV